MTRQEKAIRREQMKAFKAEGHTHEEVAEKFGVTEGYSYQICSGIAPQHHYTPRRWKNQYASSDGIENTIDERLQRAQKYFDKNAVGFEYVSGFTGVDAPVMMRHTTCGTVFQITMIAIRHEQIKCPECIRREREEREAIKKEQREQHKAQIERERTERREQREKEEAERIASRLHTCPMCGKETTRKKYCSKRCADKAAWRNKEIKRRIKTESEDADKDITLEKLYEMEHGICYICGGKCRWGDHKKRDGAFIVGETYPTIEHRIPLSRGGTHTWDNVRLACHGCNSKKGADMPLSLF